MPEYGLKIPSSFEAYNQGAQINQQEKDRKKRARFGELAGQAMSGDLQNYNQTLKEMTTLDPESAMQIDSFMKNQQEKQRVQKEQQEKQTATATLNKINVLSTAPAEQKVALYQQIAPEHFAQTTQQLGRPPTPQEIDQTIAMYRGELEAKAGRAPDVVSAKDKAEMENRLAIAKLMAQSRENVAQNRTYGIAGLTDEQNDALFGPNGAVTTGKLDPYKVNSRTARLYADAYLKSPNVDMNKLGSNAALQRNQSFMLKSFTIEALPEIMGSMVEAGKKVGFADNRTIGKMQAWVKGEFNDPDYTEYMVQRNDALMNIAAVMRGVGMSDQAHRAEMEVSSPSMNPAALDAWLRGQMKNLTPRLKQFRGVTGTPPSTTEENIVDWNSLK